MAEGKETGSGSRFKAIIKPGEDKTETRWYRWDKEEEQWEFYGNQPPSWDELSGEARDALARAHEFVLRSYYEKERRKAIERGMDPEEFPEVPKTMLEVLYYLDKARNQETGR